MHSLTDDGARGPARPAVHGRAGPSVRYCIIRPRDPREQRGGRVALDSFTGGGSSREIPIRRSDRQSAYDPHHALTAPALVRRSY
ncbi:hypothetical protein EVAR_49969_1 [Eumeta japonica]|uniref:Uncharacterized protein n=1 Tax=Eumeta variegata TaxID=151549 RepID=A0A4C1YMP2_EUMVA|nr:hypothetical protein EVAR_49969_1 [Eumeta japonica]